MSLHGCAEKAAVMLSKISWKEVDLVNLREHPPPDLGKYDTVIIGGSIHMETIQDKIKKFCNENEQELLGKRLGLYLCHIYEGESALIQFRNAYTKKLRDHAVAKGLFGGELNIEKMSPYEKSLMKKAGGVDKNISRINQQAIEGFGRVIFHLDKS